MNDKEKKFMDRIKSEQGTGSPIRNKDLICKDCKFRFDDSEIFGNTTSCEYYPDHTKPNDIVFNHASCTHYQKEA